MFTDGINLSKKIFYYFDWTGSLIATAINELRAVQWISRHIKNSSLWCHKHKPWTNSTFTHSAYSTLAPLARRRGYFRPHCFFNEVQHRPAIQKRVHLHIGLKVISHKWIRDFSTLNEKRNCSNDEFSGRRSLRSVRLGYWLLKHTELIAVQCLTRDQREDLIFTRTQLQENPGRN